MKEQFQHRITTSFFMWFDNFLLTKGEAFSNKTGVFFNYDDARLDSDYTVFGSAYKQFVNDNSIEGAIVKTGISEFKLPTYKVDTNDDVHSFVADVDTGIAAMEGRVSERFYKVTGNLTPTGGQNLINDWVSFEPNYNIFGSGIPGDLVFRRFNRYTEGGKTKYQYYIHNGTANGSPINAFFDQSIGFPPQDEYPWLGRYTEPSDGQKIYKFSDPKDTGDNNIASELNFVSTSVLDFENGRVIETGSILTGGSSVTGEFAVKDFNVYITNDTEDDLIIENKYVVNSRLPSAADGYIAPYDDVVPAIFLSTANSRNEPFAFGGLQNTSVQVKAVILAEDTYQLDGVLSIFMDSVNECITSIPMTGYPSTELGDVKDGSYSYTGTEAGYTDNRKFYVDSVTTSKLTDRDRKSLAHEMYVGFIDFDIKQMRMRFA